MTTTRDMGRETAERETVAAMAFDPSIIDRCGITRDMFASPAYRAAANLLLTLHTAFPADKQFPFSRIAWLVGQCPELGTPFSDETLTLAELPQILDSGSYTIDFIAGNVATLKAAATEDEYRHRLVELDALPVERRVDALERLACDLRQMGGGSRSSLSINTTGELVTQYPSLRKPVIDGIGREGEVVNIISKSKVGKSWFGYGLALSVVTGSKWLGQFWCERGKVLLIDNELHRDNLAFRIPTVANALSINASDYHDSFHVCSLRGRLRTIFELDEILNESRKGEYAVVIIDALYRMFPPEMSENDNAVMASIYNILDQYAEATGALIIIVHHASKGLQTGKDTTDIGAGAGAQSRAADSHLVLLPHEDPDAVVLNAVVRSFKPVDPIVLRWNFPLWSPAEDLDPNALKGTKTAKQNEVAAAKLEEKRKRVVDFLGRAEYRTTGATQNAIKNGTGISVGLLAVLNSLVDNENLVTCEIVHPKSKIPSAAWKVTPDESIDGLPDGFAGRNSVLQSGSNPSNAGRIPLKGKIRPASFDGLPKSMQDGLAPEDDTSNQSAKTGKRKPRKASKGKARKASA